MPRPLSLLLALALVLFARPAFAENFAILKWIDGSCTIAGTSSSSIDMEGVTVLGLYKARAVGEDALLKLFKDKKCKTLRGL